MQCKSMNSLPAVDLPSEGSLATVVRWEKGQVAMTLGRQRDGSCRRALEMSVNIDYGQKSVAWGLLVKKMGKMPFATESGRRAGC